MFESLRRFGGEPGAGNAIAVISRPPPHVEEDPATIPRSGRDLLRAKPHPRYAWYHFMNKPLALGAAESETDDDVLVFLDADTPFSDPRHELVLTDETALPAARRTTELSALPGPDSEYDREWRHIARAVGIDVEQLPWTQPYAGGPQIRLYLNGGVIAYRREVDSLDHYHRALERERDAGSGFSREASTGSSRSVSALPLSPRACGGPPSRVHTITPWRVTCLSVTRRKASNPRASPLPRLDVS